MSDTVRVLSLLGACLAIGIGSALSMRELLHLFQLESYQLPGYFRALRRVGWRVWMPGAAIAAVSLCSFVIGEYAARRWLAGFLVASLAPLLTALYIHRMLSKRPAKKPLHFTPRARRLLIAACVVVVLLFAAYTALMLSLEHWLGLPAACMLALLALPPLLNPLWLALTARAVQPLEARINRSFFKDAQRLLRERPELIRIGITGSYGKTSTKFLLATLLSEKYTVLATPSSFNTPMGVTRVIREQLKPEHEVFIAEMGARHVGDIREMCELVRPAIGLLTSVGPQHLETFGSIERVAQTKYELIEALPEDGAAFFARDGAICERLYARCPLRQKCMAGEHLRAEGIEAGPWGSRFELVDADGARVACQTRLLGAHNIDNLLLCAEAALHLGLSLEQLAAGIAKLEPVEHRLQLLDSGNGVTVIDDAFNSNPAGAKAALDVLRSFPPRRIVVTPGMVELGAQQDVLNESFGRQMADSADIAVLIGKRRAEPIARGLEKGGFDAANLHVVANLEESTALLATLLRAGDTVLYENDLPENYAE